MPVLETADNMMPGSALRHRPIADDVVLKEHVPVITSPMTPVVKRASRLREPDTTNDVPEWKRAHSDDTQHHGTSKPAGRASPTTRMPPKTTQTARTVTKTRKQPFHPLLYLGVGMIVTVSLLAVVIAVSNWVSTTLDDLHYGRPRTFQIDAYVGHNEAPGMPSHFIALNLHGRLEVIELPGGDPMHARIYLGPQLYGPNADLVPVTLSFKDVHGDHRPEMILHFQGTQVIFLNTGSGFQSAASARKKGSRLL